MDVIVGLVRISKFILVFELILILGLLVIGVVGIGLMLK